MMDSGPSGDDAEPQAVIREVPSADFAAPEELAAEFGGDILVPSWWPSSMEAASYASVGSPSRVHYSVMARRAEGELVCVMGCWETTWAGRSPKDWLDGEWSEPEHLAHLRGLVGRVGHPQSLQVVLDDHQLAVQLFGPHDDEEIASMTKSLRRVAPR